MAEARRSWSDADRAFLERLSPRRDWIEDAMNHFPDRSEAAVRCMMQKVREGIGVTETRFMENAWMADAHNGTAMLLDRLVQTGLRP